MIIHEFDDLIVFLVILCIVICAISIGLSFLFVITSCYKV